jgi:MFS family permease
MDNKLIIRAICGLNIVLSFALVSNFLPIYLDSMGISLVNIGLVFAFGAMIAGIIRFPVGTMADKIGRRPLMIIGAVGYPLFAIGVVFSRTTVHFVGIKLLVEIFGALFWIAFWAYIYDTIHRGEEGKGIAHANMVVGAGNIIAPFVGGLIISYYGFAHLFYLAAIIGVMNIIFISLVVKDYGKSSHETLEMLEHDIASEYKHLVNMKKFRVLTTIGVLHNVAWGVWYVYMPIYLRGLGTSIQHIGILLSVTYLVSMLSQYPLGKMIDKFPSKYIIIPGFFLVWASGFAFLLFKDYFKFVIARSAMGLGFNMEWNPLCARLSHLTPKKEHGGTTGLFRAANALSVGIITIVAGYLADLYTIKVVLLGASSFAFVVAFVLLFINKGIMAKGKSLVNKHHLVDLHGSSVNSEKKQNYIL